MTALKVARKLKREETGSVVVLVALSLSVLLMFSALVLDIGFMYVERVRLVTAAEAGALAGASNLPYREDGQYTDKDYEHAREVAKQVTKANGVDRDQFQVRILPEDEDKKDIVEVVAEQEVDYTFARVMGFEQGTVTGSSKAETFPISGLSGITPVGIPESRIDETDGEHTLIAGGSDEEIEFGHFGFLDPGEEGPQGLADNLKDNYDGQINIGMNLETLTGARRSNANVDAIEERFQEGEILYVPIITDFEPGDNVEVLGFGAFELTEDAILDTPGKTTITGKFKGELSEGEIEQGTEDYGLRTTKLIE